MEKPVETMKTPMKTPHVHARIAPVLEAQLRQPPLDRQGFSPDWCVVLPGHHGFEGQGDLESSFEVGFCTT